MVRLALLACVLGVACKRNADKPPPPPPRVETPVEDPCAKAKPEGPIAWIADDYAAALACARQKRTPLVLDLWAPWCHTCLSMQATVFQDKSFAARRNDFVFASLDTDREANAAALAKLSISAWPTFYVLGADEQVLSRLVGGATVSQFSDFLDAGAHAAIGGDTDLAASRMLGADRALAKHDLATAEEELTATLKAAPDAWARRPEVYAALVLTKYKRGDIAGCLAVADQYMPVAGNVAAASDFLATAMMCAEKAEPAVAKAIRERAVARWKELLADPTAQLSVDDRQDALASLRETLDTLGKKADARALAEQQKKLLDDAIAKAPTPLAAMTYQGPAAEVYAYLGRPLDLVPVLEKSAKDLPNEYNPRARLGWLYLKAQKLDLAAKWTDEALALVYGPRKGRVLGQRADIAAAAKDPAAEKSFREQAVKLYEALPPGQQQPENLAHAREALQKLATP